MPAPTGSRALANSGPAETASSVPRAGLRQKTKQRAQTPQSEGNLRGRRGRGLNVAGCRRCPLASALRTPDMRAACVRGLCAAALLHRLNMMPTCCSQEKEAASSRRAEKQRPPARRQRLRASRRCRKSEEREGEGSAGKTQGRRAEGWHGTPIMFFATEQTPGCGEVCGARSGVARGGGGGQREAERRLARLMLVNRSRRAAGLSCRRRRPA